MSKRKPVDRNEFYGERTASIRRGIFTQDTTHVDIAAQKTLETELEQYNTYNNQIAGAQGSETSFYQQQAVSQLISLPKTSLERDREEIVKRLHDIIAAPTFNETLSEEQYQAIKNWVEGIVKGPTGNGKAAGSGDRDERWSVYQPESYSIPDGLRELYGDKALDIAKELENLQEVSEKIKTVEKDIALTTEKIINLSVAMEEGQSLEQTLIEDKDVGAYVKHALEVKERETAKANSPEVQLIRQIESNLEHAKNEAREYEIRISSLPLLDKLQCNGQPPKLSELTDEQLKLVAPLILGSAAINTLDRNNRMHEKGVTYFSGLDIQEYVKSPRIEIESDLYVVLEGRNFQLSSEIINSVKQGRGSQEIANLGDLDFSSTNDTRALLDGLPENLKQHYEKRIKAQHDEIKATQERCKKIMNGLDQDYVNAMLTNLKAPEDPSLGLNSRERLEEALTTAKRNSDVTLDFTGIDISGVNFSELDFTGVNVKLTPEQLSTAFGLTEVTGIDPEVLGNALGTQIVRKLEFVKEDSSIEKVQEYTNSLDALTKFSCNGQLPDFSKISDEDLRQCAYIILSSDIINILDVKNKLNVSRIHDKKPETFLGKSREELIAGVTEVLGARNNQLSEDLLLYVQSSRLQAIVPSMERGSRDVVDRAEAVMEQVPPAYHDKIKGYITEIKQQKKDMKDSVQKLGTDIDNRLIRARLENLNAPVDPGLRLSPKERLMEIVSFAQGNEKLTIDFTGIDVGDFDFSGINFSGATVIITAEQLSKTQDLESVKGIDPAILEQAKQPQLMIKHLTPLKQAESCAKSAEILEKILKNKEQPGSEPISLAEKKAIFNVVISKFVMKEAMVEESNITVTIDGKRLSDSTFRDFITFDQYAVAHINPKLSDKDIEQAFDTIVNSFTPLDVTTSLLDMYSSAQGNSSDFMRKYSQKEGVSPSDVESGKAIKSHAENMVIEMKNRTLPTALGASGNLDDKAAAVKEHISIVRDSISEWNDSLSPQSKIIKVQNVDLSGLDLSGENLSGVDFTGSNLKDVNLEGANLEGAKITAQQLKDVRGILRFDGLEEISIDEATPQKTQGKLLEGVDGKLLQQAKQLKLDDLAKGIEGQLKAWNEFKNTLTKQGLAQFGPALEQIEKNMDTMQRAIGGFQQEVQKHGGDFLKGTESLEKAFEMNQKALSDLITSEARRDNKLKIDHTLLKTAEKGAKEAGVYAESAKQGNDNVVIPPEKKPNLFQRIGRSIAKIFETKIEGPMTHAEEYANARHTGAVLKESGLIEKSDQQKIEQRAFSEHLDKAPKSLEPFVQKVSEQLDSEQPQKPRENISKAAKMLLDKGEIEVVAQKVSEQIVKKEQEKEQEQQQAPNGVDRRTREGSGLREKINKYPPEERETEAKKVRGIFDKVKSLFGISGASKAEKTEKGIEKQQTGISQDHSNDQGRTL